MKIKLLPLLSLLLVSSGIFAQNQNNTIEDQFTDVIEKSNSYQEFKVIKKTKIDALRRNVLDSVAAFELAIDTANSEIEKQKDEIATLTQNLSATQERLAASIEKENGIELFGIVTKKSTYNTVLWSIIVGLFIILAILFLKFKSSHAMTKAAKLKLTETESEFEVYRQKTLENEQVLRRKLQDEINKNRNVN